MSAITTDFIRQIAAYQKSATGEHSTTSRVLYDAADRIEDLAEENGRFRHALMAIAGGALKAHLIAEAAVRPDEEAA